MDPKPETPTAEQIGDLRRTRIFDSPDSGSLRVYAEEDVNEHLDADECDLDEGTALHEEGEELLAEVREILDEGSGGVVELE